MIDYTICYRELLAPNDPNFTYRSFDFFWAALTADERAKALYDKVSAVRKQWVILPEYGFAATEIPSGSYAPAGAGDEAELITSFLDGQAISPSSTICIDITGFLAPYLLFLLRALANRGVGSFELLYSEPGKYLDSEETQFSSENVHSVRQVYGYEGTHTTDTSKDALIIGVGYDHQLLKIVASTKEGARAIQLFGLPALRPDMYQQNILRASRAADAMGRPPGEHRDNWLLPAHDPFTTATILSRFFEEGKFTNLYLCPLATKPQVLGFGIFYINECLGKPISILYPFCNSFPKRTSVGVGRVWAYSAEIGLTPCASTTV
jgi:hypothetical protein